MNCHTIENLWIDYFDAVLDDASRKQLDGHLLSCAKCTALVAEMRANLVLAGAIPEIEPPPRLIRKILEATSGAPPAPAWYDFIFDFIRPQQLPKFAMGSVMALASLAVVLYALGFNFRQVTTADLNPARLWERTNREVHLAYSRGVKYYNALRIVYEIQSRFEGLSASTDDQNPATPSNPPRDASPHPGSKPGSQRISQELDELQLLVQNFKPAEKHGGLS